MSITSQPPEDDYKAMDRDSSRELRPPVPPYVDNYQSRMAHHISRPARLQHSVNSFSTSLTENSSGSRDSFSAHIGSQQPALPDNRRIEQATFTPQGSTSQASGPTSFASYEQVEQLPFPSHIPGGLPGPAITPATQAPLSGPPAVNQITTPAAQSSPNKKKKGLSKQLMLMIRIGITLVLIALILKGVSWSAVVSTYAHVHFTDLLVGLCMGLLGVVFSSYLWHRLVQAENIQADMSHLTRLYLIGVAFSNFLPTSMGGDALKAYYVGRDSGNMPGSASAVVLARITGFFGMMLMATPVLIVLHASFNGLLVQRFVLLSLLYLSSFGGALIIAAFLPRIQQKYVKGAWASNKFVLKAFETGTTLLLSFKRPRPLIEAIIFGFLFWITNCLNYYEYAVALGVQTPFRFYLLAVPFIGVIGALPISISGYGVREGLVEYLYSTIHVPTSTALSVVLLMDMQRILFSLLGGLLFLTMENRARNVETTAAAG
jgi:uncharacterized protein (TIRG00374 family)